MLDKKTLRTQLLATRKSIPPAMVNASSLALCEELLARIPQGVSVAGYMPIRFEMDISFALMQLFARKHIVALPAIIEGEKILKFLQWNSAEALITGHYDIAHPPHHAPEIAPDIVIVPLLGFDRKGGRIGYGGGYYDATIAHLRAKNKRVQVWGAAYSMQEIDAVPMEAHDAQLDAVITEKEFITI